MRLDRDSVEPLTITDLEGTEDDVELRTIALQFNPESITREITANYGSHAPIGFTGTIEHFVGNSNTAMALEIFYAATWSAEYELLVDARAFIESLLFPSNKAVSIQTNAPPKLLILWPHNLSLECRAKNLRITDELYDPDGRVLQFSATLTVFEIVGERLNKEFVRQVGPQRRETVEI